ncbi:MAG TPA: NfeD family protein [Actinomycetota bacterium]|nr:NfeD family protein [Actinomycetota bacterium]
MRRPAFPIALAVCVLALLWVGTASAQTPASSKVLVAKVDGSIDRTVAGYLVDSLAEGERTGAAVVIQLDSAGTLDQPAVELAERLFRSRVPVIVWVGPAPAKAQGAALLFLYASSLAAVAPGAGVGPLQPVDLVDATNATLPNDAALQRMAVGWAEARGRPAPAIPTSLVPAQEALDGHVAQAVATSLPDLLSKIDGSTVQTAGGLVTLHTKIAQSPTQQPVDVRFTELGPFDRVLHAVASPAAIYLLLVLGLAGLAFELTQAGFGFAGFAGLGMLALAVYGLTVVPASWPGIGLLVAGVVLLCADVLLHRLGVLTVAGVVAFLVGSFMSFRGVAPAIGISPWLIGLLAVGSVLYYGFALTVAQRSRERIATTQRGLVGLLGETRGELKPEGPVYVKGTLWRGRSNDGPIPPGTRVRVRGVDGLVLRVEPDPGAVEDLPPDDA